MWIWILHVFVLIQCILLCGFLLIRMLFLTASFCSNCGSHVLQLLHAPWWKLLPGASPSGHRRCCLLQRAACGGDSVRYLRCSHGSSPSWYHTPASPRHHWQHQWAGFYRNVYKVPTTRQICVLAGGVSFLHCNRECVVRVLLFNRPCFELLGEFREQTSLGFLFVCFCFVFC